MHIISGRNEEDPLQMPPIVEFTSECTREKEWDNIAAIHSGLVVTTTWSFHQSKMGELKLVPEQFQNKNRKDFIARATCISLTHCGNFVIIGEFGPCTLSEKEITEPLDFPQAILLATWNGSTFNRESIDSTTAAKKRRTRNA